MVFEIINKCVFFLSALVTPLLSSNIKQTETTNVQDGR